MIKAAKANEAPVTEWETFEGVTYGYDAEGSLVIEIDARVPIGDNVLEHESNVRGWAVFTHGSRAFLNAGHAKGLREAKKAALAALRAA